MTKSAEAGEVAKRFEEYLQEVQSGNEVLVTRAHTPIARIVAIEPTRPNARRSIGNLKPLSGRWIGERVIKSGDLAEEMYAPE